MLSVGFVLDCGLVTRLWVWLVGGALLGGFGLFVDWRWVLLACLVCWFLCWLVFVVCVMMFGADLLVFGCITDFRLVLLCGLGWVLVFGGCVFKRFVCCLVGCCCSCWASWFRWFLCVGGLPDCFLVYLLIGWLLFGDLVAVVVGLLFVLVIDLQAALWLVVNSVGLVFLLRCLFGCLLCMLFDVCISGLVACVFVGF